MPEAPEDAIATEARTSSRERAFRKRAKRACLACRARKVRCDVAQRQTSCTNCFLDKHECVVQPRPLKYRAAIIRAEENSRRQDALGVASLEQDLLNHQNAPATKLFPGEIQQNDGDDTSNYENSPDQSTEEVVNVRVFSDGPFMAEDNELKAAGGTAVSGSTHILFSFYPFLELDIQPHVFSDDVNFLESQGCFRVPTRPALDEFMREYFLHVHPSLPIINERTFWEMYTHRAVNPSGSPRISLFVFQCMLFASCSFLPLTIIRRLGFSNIRSARATYYRRAKLLFDFNRERDFISTAQGTLLLTYNGAIPNYKQINSFWLRIAIGFAKEGDAHRYHTNMAQTPERRNVLKRLWWCCILRDRILPLGVRRPLHISSMDFDFEASPLTKEDFESEVGHSKVYNSFTKQSLIELFLALSALAVSLTDVIMVVYPLNEASATELSSEENAEQTIIRIESCKSKLNRWFEIATIDCPTPAGIGDVHKSMILYTNLMYIYYYTAKLALYHHEVLVLSTPVTLAGRHWNRMCQSKRQVEEAAAAITENLKELIQLKLARYLPISIVAYAALPLVLHILDVKLSTTESQIARKQRRLNIYTEAMKALKLQYDGADEVSEMIGKIIGYVSLDSRSQGYPLDQSRKPLSLQQDTCGLKGPSSKAKLSVNTIKDWGDVLLRQPSLYLRLALTLDLYLAKGRFPDDTDFPSTLQSRSQIKTHFPLYRITMMEEENIKEDWDSGLSNNNVPLDERGISLECGSQGGEDDLSTASLGSSLISHADDFTEHLHTPLTSLPEQLELSMFSGSFDMGLPDDSGSMFDYPAAWADGMFLDDD